MRYTSVLLAAFAVAGFTGSAVAADYIPTPAATPGYWNGMYVGVQGGYANDTATFSAPGEAVPFGKIDPKGWQWGGRAGVDYQTGNIVLGLLGDVSSADITANVTDLGGEGSDVHGKIDITGSVRGRIGMAFGNLLVYGTGGVAFAHVNATVSNLVGGDLGSGSTSVTHTGWTAGAGVELALTDNMSLAGEWLYADYGTQNYHFEDAAGTLDADTHLTGNTFLGAVNYRFR